MERLHARYPFLESASEAVEAASVDLVALVEEESPIVDRAADRVETALSEGRVGEPRRPRVELLSYPIARVLVSLLDEPRAVQAYARAEAATARERFQADVESGDDLRSTGDSSLSLARLRAELDLDGRIVDAADGYEVEVGTYLRLADDREGGSWRLVERSLSDGRVPVSERELYALLETAITDRVAAGLPLSVPEAVETALQSEVTALESMVTSHDVQLEFPATVPALFPPCMRALVDRARDGERLPPQASFALVAFLAGCGLDDGEIAEFLDTEVDPETVEYQLAHVRGDRGVEYAPPSCATMQAYELCVNRDDRCDRITHPADYYVGALDDEAEQFPAWDGE